MCWRCGTVRPYDAPSTVRRVGPPDSYCYQVGDIVYRAQEITLCVGKDDDEILRLIDAGIINTIDGDIVGWQELSAFPPFESSFFTQEREPEMDLLSTINATNGNWAAVFRLADDLVITPGPIVDVTIVTTDNGQCQYIWRTGQTQGYQHTDGHGTFLMEALWTIAGMFTVYTRIEETLRDDESRTRIHLPSVVYDALACVMRPFDVPDHWR